ncbi:MAG: hypothetical protein GKR98_05550 [Boseongicola sp.]|nr:MAG: hypothetical protein GKR98_05550 [Boseongicola sp.]
MGHSASYDIGYGKPPKQTQFAPGNSGNPKGRSKGAKNKRPALHEESLKEIVLDEAYRDISVRDGDNNVSMPMAQAIMRSLAVNTAKGQHRAQRLFAEILTTTERQNKQLADEWLSTAMDYKIEWDEELRRRERLGITDLPDPLPHLDQVKIDMNTGMAWVQGPMTREDKAKLEEWVRKQHGFREDLEFVREELEVAEDNDCRASLEADFAHTRKMVDVIQKVLDVHGYKDPA